MLSHSLIRLYPGKTRGFTTSLYTFRTASCGFTHSFIQNIARRVCSINSRSLSLCTKPVSLIGKADNMDLKAVVTHLNAFAPLPLAESWDNVGLLVEPTSPCTVEKMLLTVDLTEKVLEEAIAMKANLIVSYHPPIFSGLKRLTQGPEGQRVIVRAIENHIAIYSPHTAYDTLQGGVNDWLARAVGPEDDIAVKPISPYMEKQENTRQISIIVPCACLPAIYLALSPLCAPCVAALPLEGSKKLLQIHCNEYNLEATVSAVCAITGAIPYQVQELLSKPLTHTGSGRIVTLSEPISIDELVNRVKTHLKLKHVRLALPHKAIDKITTVGICAGSGRDVLKGVPADVYLTGEMGHHDVLDANRNGTAVILCEHSNSERGFLSGSLRETLLQLFGRKIEVAVSQVDRDPLEVV